MSETQGTQFSAPRNRVQLRDSLPPGVYDKMAPADRKKLAAQLNVRECERKTSLPAYRRTRFVAARSRAHRPGRGQRRARPEAHPKRRPRPTRAGPEDAPPPQAMRCRDDPRPHRTARL